MTSTNALEMHEFVVRANIARFRTLLADKPDAATRELLERLLAEQTQRLGSLGLGHAETEAAPEQDAASSPDQSPTA